MEKDQNSNLEKNKSNEKISNLDDISPEKTQVEEKNKEQSPKEKDDAFDYGGFALARETLNLIDNLERAKQSLENDETLKNSEALKKL